MVIISLLCLYLYNSNEKREVRICIVVDKSKDNLP